MNVQQSLKGVAATAAALTLSLVLAGCGQVDESPASTSSIAEQDSFESQSGGFSEPPASEMLRESESLTSSAPSPDDAPAPLPSPASPTSPGMAGVSAEAFGLSADRGAERKQSANEPESAAMATPFSTVTDPAAADERAEKLEQSITFANGPVGKAEGTLEEGQNSPELRNAPPGAPPAGSAAAGRVQVGRETSRKSLSFDLLPGEELWVIARSAETSTAPARRPDVPGCGSLMALPQGETTQVPVPLKHTDVKASVDGYIATVDVTQQFHNPFASKIEAVYVFPLPENAAVNDFVMTVGERRIRGVIRERTKAEQIYRQARAQGHVASLLTEERPNIFTQKVANIEPGKQIDINIRYLNTLRYDDGSYEFVFPMVVGPRFNPPASADGIGATGRQSPGSSGQTTEVSYLTPGERSGHDISLTLNIEAGVELRGVRSVNHQVETRQSSRCGRQIVLSPGDAIPNRDFVVRFDVAGDSIGSGLITQQDAHGQYFTLMLFPPADLKHVQRSPMEMVFVLDCSGSMNGRPIEQAKAAIAHALQQLSPRDTFQIIQFNNSSSQLGTAPVVATEDNIQAGLRYLSSLNGAGGTHMLEGIKAALDFPHDEGRFRLVSFMTDGYIGNEQQILSTLGEKLGESRVFSFGVGQSPNRYLMDRMAVMGRGAVSYLSLNDDAADIMDRFQQRISHPAMTDLWIDFGDMQVTDVYPQRLPDLIVGRPVILTGRFQGEPSSITVNGRLGHQPHSFVVNREQEDGSSAEQGQRSSSIAAVWARMKIADLMLAAVADSQQTSVLHGQVLQTALNYNLMSRFTAFVAVDSLSQTEGAFGTTVAVPVPVPEGVRYETSVSN